MDEAADPLRMDQPARYRIKLLGRLSAAGAATLEDFSLTAERSAGAPPISILEGPVADQAALFGLLSRLRDLGLPLLLVEYLSGISPDTLKD
jgi:hypothetical protein